MHLDCHTSIRVGSNEIVSDPEIIEYSIHCAGGTEISLDNAKLSQGKMLHLCHICI